jgi:uncharacterized protein (TIGR02246 family)
MRKKTCYLLTAAVAIGLGVIFLKDRIALAPAQAANSPEQKGTVAVRPADTEAIHKLSQAFLAAFEKGDAKAIASSWTEQGEYVDDNTGEMFVGRERIENAFADLFRQLKVAQLDMHIQSIRFPSRDTALEEGYSRLGTVTCNAAICHDILHFSTRVLASIAECPWPIGNSMRW